MPALALDALVAQLERDPSQGLWHRVLATASRAGDPGSGAALLRRAWARAGAGEALESQLHRTLWEGGFGLGDPGFQYPSPVVGLAWSRDRSWLAVATASHGIEVLRAGDFSVHARLDLPDPQRIRFSADGTGLLAAGRGVEGGAGVLRLASLRLDVPGGARAAFVLPLPGKGAGRVEDLAGDGSRAVLWLGTGRLALLPLRPWRRWDQLTGLPRPTPVALPASRLPLRGAGLSPDDRFLLVRRGPHPTEVVLVDLESGEAHELPSPPPDRASWHWSPDGLGLAALWQDEDKLGLAFYDPFEPDGCWQSRLEDAPWMVWTGSGKARTEHHELDARRRLTRDAPAPAPPPAGVPAPRAELVAELGEPPRWLTVRQRRTRAMVAGPTTHPSPIRGLSVGGTRLASWDPVGGTVLWDLAQGTWLARVPPAVPGRPGLPARVAADGSRVLVAQADRVELFDGAGTRLRAWPDPVLPHWGSVRAVALSRDGRRGAVGTSESYLLVFDTGSGRLLREEQVAAHALWGVGFAADGETALPVLDPGLEPEGEGEAEGLPPCVIEHPCGEGVAFASGEGPRLLRPGGRVDPLLPGRTPLACFAFSPDGQALAGVDPTGEVVIYDLAPARLARRKPKARFRPGAGAPGALAWLPDGRRLVYAQLGHLRLHGLDGPG